jgi:NAD(P)-dependent dehydrogenase (short-subunit alcohol dehydrogenase family)
MSKAGVHAMTQSLAVEWGPRGIRLNAIAPGPFPTKGAWERLMPQTGSAKPTGDGSETIPLRRMGKHEELANLAAFLMSEQTEYLTGECIAIDGGQWLTSGGNFHQLSSLGDTEWNAIRAMIQASNAKDKAARVPS